MITILLTSLLIVFYILGAVFFSLFTGINMSKTKNVLLIIFYPVTMWFIK